MSTDGSNDTDLNKMNPITVKLFDVNRSRVVTRFLDMGTTQDVNAATASAMPEATDKAMSKNTIPWCNCKACLVDNTSANLGKFNSIKTRIIEKIQTATFLDVHAIFFITLPVKLCQNSRKFPVLMWTIHLFSTIFSTFSISQRNKYTQFCDLVYHKMLRYKSTCWLSLDMSVNCFLSGYVGLKSYFLSGK